MVLSIINSFLYHGELHGLVKNRIIVFVAVATKTFNSLSSEPHLDLSQGTGT